MPKRREINKSKYLAVFAITTLIFIVGLIIGNQFANQKLEQIDRLGSELKTDTMAMELQYELIADDPCAHVDSAPLAEELYEMASKLDYMENRLSENDKSVIDLKKYYSLLEIQHWLFMKKTKEECGQNSSLILFFYQNENECSNCKEQGFVLTWLRRNYENVYVYSFDYDLDNVALDTLKRMNNVERTPALVIGNQTYDNFLSKKDLQEIMYENNIQMIQ